MKLFAVLLLIAGLLTPAQYERRTEWRANQAREAFNRDRLPHGRCVARYAETWAEHLATTGQFYHQNLERPIARCRGRRAGEVLISGDVFPRRAVSLWLDSRPHRRLLLHRRFDHMAVGAAFGGDGSWVVSIVFIGH